LRASVTTGPDPAHHHSLPLVGGGHDFAVDELATGLEVAGAQPGAGDGPTPCSSMPAAPARQGPCLPGTHGARHDHRRSPRRLRYLTDRAVAIDPGAGGQAGLRLARSRRPSPGPVRPQTPVLKWRGHAPWRG